MYATDLNGDVADYFFGSPLAFKLAIPVATAGSPATLPVFMAGGPLLNGQREYVLSQDLPDTPAGAIACNLSPRTGPDGVVTPIEITSNTTDPAIPMGKCPVFAVETPDLQRLFVLNRGDDTISVDQRQKQCSRRLYTVREPERTDRHLSSINAPFHSSSHAGERAAEL